MSDICFELDGRSVAVADDGSSLLDVLRGHLGVVSAKDGCSPQGQCGCCTVLVDGEARVACVTPARRVEGRSVTTYDGLGATATDEWSGALCATGGSQCGFCTPGIVVRLEWLRRRGSLGDRAAIERALAAHLCRCTGWQTIAEAAELVAAERSVTGARDLAAASRRATIEGGSQQIVGPEVVAGSGGFAEDTAPADALVAMVDASGEWHVADDVSHARAAAGKVQGRRTTVAARPPIAIPPGDWDASLQTSWVEPAYLELDVVWCEPGGEPRGPLANGGAFGAKLESPLGVIARRLADEHGRAVVARWSREDSVRHGPKRPPLAIGLRADGTGEVVVARTPGIAERIAHVLPRATITEVDVVGPPTSAALRGAGWVEAAVALAAATGAAEIRSPDGAVASARIAHGRVDVTVRCGEVLDATVLRSYCVGAAHMALGWVTSESIAIDDDGTIGDLTVRSFGILRASDMPVVSVEIAEDDGDPVCGSDAVFAAVALAAWRAQGLPSAWPTGRGLPA